MKKLEMPNREDCFYFTGVYCENAHCYECLYSHDICDCCCWFMSKNPIKRFLFFIELKMIQFKIDFFNWRHRNDFKRKRCSITGIKKSKS